MLARHHLSKQIETKGLISRRKFVRLGPMLSTGAFLVETGAVLGRAFRDKLHIFAYPFQGQQPADQRTSEFMRDRGREIGRLGSEATTVWELVIVSGMRLAEPARPYEDWTSWLFAEGNREMDLDTAFQELTMLAVTGAGFGAEFPERFEELYANSYARQDPADWKRLHEAGLGIPPEQDEFVSLDTRTKNDLTMFAEYCAEFYPDYVAQLGLEEYVGG